MNKTIGFVDCTFRSPASEGASRGGAHSHGERREVVVNGTSEDGRYPRTLRRAESLSDLG